MNTLQKLDSFHENVGFVMFNTEDRQYGLVETLHQNAETPFPSGEEIAKTFFEDDVREKVRMEKCREERMKEFDEWINHIIELYE